MEEKKGTDSTDDVFLRQVKVNERKASSIVVHEDTSVLNGLFWRKPRDEMFPPDGFPPINLRQLRQRSFRILTWYGCSSILAGWPPTMRLSSAGRINS